MLRNPYKRYRLVLNNCYDSTSLKVVLSNSAQEDILVMHYNYSVGQDSYYARDEDSRKFSIDILDHTYYDVIEIPGNETSPIHSILFLYEYGVIQIQYEKFTFSINNIEN